MDKKRKRAKKILVEDVSDQRIDLYLKKIFPGSSRNHLQRLISEKKVFVDERAVSKNFIVKKGNVISIKDFETDRRNDHIKPQNIDIKVLFEDKNIIVISKPAGIVSHPSSTNREGTVVNALLYRFKELSNNYGKSRAGIVHRLDKDTSGIMIIAKNNKAHDFISRQFADRKISKTYLCLVMGRLDEKTGEIDLPIGRNKEDMKISIDRGKDSFTRFRTIETFDRCTYLKVSPKTGRTHQIRVHLSYIGHPVMGDKKYGNRDSVNYSKIIGLSRQYLHADTIKFINPTDNDLLSIEDELAPDLKKVLDRLRSNG